METVLKLFKYTYIVIAVYVYLYTINLIAKHGFGTEQNYPLLIEQWKQIRNLAYVIYSVSCLCLMFYMFLNSYHITDKQQFAGVLKSFAFGIISITFSLTIILLLSKLLMLLRLMLN